MRPLTESDVIFNVLAEPCDIPIRGNALASGDNETDRAHEDAIMAELQDGNVWAWTTVRVTAIVPDIREGDYDDIVGETFLGGCNYANAEEFMQSDYFAEMKAEALRDLNEQLAAILHYLQDREDD